MNEEVIITQVEATKINMQPGEVLVVTIKCDDVSYESLGELKERLGILFPNNKVAVFGIGTQDSVEFTVASNPEVGYPIKEQGEEE